MTIIRRAVKGSPISAAEFDANMDHMEAGFVSVLAYGLVPDSSGDATANTTALQTAVDDGVPLYFPPGTWYINGIIGFRDYLVIQGAGLSHQAVGLPSIIRSTHSGPMFCQTMADGTPGYFDLVGDPYPDAYTVQNARVDATVSIRNLNLYATHATGEIAVIHGAHPGSGMWGCHIQGYFRGVFFRGFGPQVSGCFFAGSGAGSDSGLLSDAPEDFEDDMDLALTMWGLLTEGYVSDCSFTDWGVGVVYPAVHGGLARCRFEVNRWGLVVGGYPLLDAGYPFEPLEEPTFETYIPGRSMLHSMTMEANKRGITINDAQHGFRLQSFGIQGAGPSDYGLLVNNLSKDVVIDGGQVFGSFIRGGVINMEGASIRNVNSANSYGDLAGWLGSRHGYTIGLDIGHAQINGHGNWTANSANSPAAHQSISFFPDLHLRGLNNIDVMNTNVLANNLGDVASVTTSATSVAVAFRAAIGISSYGWTTTVAENDGASTLAADTYYYFITAVCPDGETGVSTAAGNDSVISLTITAGKRASLGFRGAISSSLRRRIYRGTSLDRTQVDGYWEITAASPFLDTGQAFDGRDIPRGEIPEGNLPSRYELDTNYQVIVTPSWSTTAYVEEADKATSGFTIKFGTAAPAGGVCRWLLFRP